LAPARRPRRARRARARPRAPPGGSPRARPRSSPGDDPVAAPARVAGGRERPVGAPFDACCAAEEQVATAPPDDVVAEPLAPVELRGLVAALAVDVRLVEVDARP